MSSEYNRWSLVNRQCISDDLSKLWNYPFTNNLYTWTVLGNSLSFFKTTYYRWRSSQCYLNSLINDPFLFLCYYRHVTSGTNNKVYCLNNPTSHFLTNFLQQSNRHYAMFKMLIFIGRAVRARWNPWNPLHCRFVYSILCSKRIINKPSCYVMLC